jgi:hypothetical protein
MSEKGRNVSRVLNVERSRVYYRCSGLRLGAILLDWASPGLMKGFAMFFEIYIPKIMAV